MVFGGGEIPGFPPKLDILDLKVLYHGSVNLSYLITYVSLTAHALCQALISNIMNFK